MLRDGDEGCSLVNYAKGGIKGNKTIQRTLRNAE